MMRFEKSSGSRGTQRLRVVFYARFSTDESHPRSIEDQISSCRRFASRIGLCDYEEVVLADVAISGRKKHRPGIDDVMHRIRNRQCDVLIAEDLSRLYRKPTFAHELLGTAIDAKVRVITVTDGIDTSDSKWRILSQVQAIHGELHLLDTAARIRRAFEGRWREGYAINPLLPGYIRRAMNPEAEDRKHKGPYKDQKDALLTPRIVEAFERAARGDRLIDIAEYLDSVGFPLPVKCKCPKWTSTLVRRLIQQPLYWGVEYYRRKTSTALEVSGETKQEPTPDQDVLSRKMPDLAHVSESLWNKANEAIRARRRHNRYSKGIDHPNTGTPRDRWGPLSSTFYCGVCGARMHRDGAGYRCCASKKRWTLAQGSKERCWNRCSPQPKIVHAKIGSAVVDALLIHANQIEALKPLIDRMVQDGDGSREKRISDLSQEKAHLSKAIEHLKGIIESAPDVNSVVDQLRKREGELECVNRELLEFREQAPKEIPLPSHNDILAEIEKFKPLLLEKLGRDAGTVLRQLVDRIEARPYKSIDSDRIILRAHFDLHLVKLLPAQWQFFLERHAGSLPSIELESMLSIPVVVDLFERPQFVRHAWEVLAMTEQGATLKEIAKSLGVTLDTAKSAKRAALLMRTKALDDFYIPLAQRPAKLSPRWRSDPPETKGGQDQEKNDGRPDEELRKTV